MRHLNVIRKNDLKGYAKTDCIIKDYKWLLCVAREGHLDWEKVEREQNE